ncbi:hypothetical protein E4U41_005026, partial [Claviceps citrina]
MDLNYYYSCPPQEPPFWDPGCMPAPSPPQCLPPAPFAAKHHLPFAADGMFLAPSPGQLPDWADYGEPVDAMLLLQQQPLQQPD